MHSAPCHITSTLQIAVLDCVWWAPYLKLAISKSFDQLRRRGLPLVSLVYFGWFALVRSVGPPPTQGSLLDFYPACKKNHRIVDVHPLEAEQTSLLKPACSGIFYIYSTDTLIIQYEKGKIDASVWLTLVIQMRGQYDLLPLRFVFELVLFYVSIPFRFQ